jgi:hypothetical protein
MELSFSPSRDLRWKIPAKNGPIPRGHVRRYRKSHHIFISAYGSMKHSALPGKKLGGRDAGATCNVGNAHSRLHGFLDKARGFGDSLLICLCIISYASFPSRKKGAPQQADDAQPYRMNGHPIM